MVTPVPLDTDDSSSDTLTPSLGAINKLFDLSFQA